MRDFTERLKVVKIRKEFIRGFLNEILLILSFLIILPLDSGAYLFPLLDKFFDILRMLSCVIMLCFVIIKYKKINEYMLLILLLSTPVLLVTVARNGDLWKCIIYVGNILVAFLFVYIFIVKKNISLRTIIYLIRFLLIINTILFVFIPEGMFISFYPDGSFNNKYQWLLGTKNSYYPLLFLYTVINEMHIYLKGVKRKYIDGFFMHFACLICSLFLCLLLEL